MKISVSLPDEDVAYLDAYAKANQVDSRSAVLQQAARLRDGSSSVDRTS